ncbi:MAG: crosslink repair DNA glycosylase YcaQ family protein [Pseudomonadota bacterium]
MMLRLNADDARRTILHLQALTRPQNRRLTSTELHDLIEALGFVQIDSIQWVERAHHMILHARNQTYRPQDLHRLTEREQLLFENWTHDASFIPSSFYPYWKHKFRREEARLHDKFHDWQGAGFVAHLDDLMRRIEQDGALMSRDLERPAGKQEMWQWHDGKAALEYLWRIGRLSIRERRNFQKVYDLPERCLGSAPLDDSVDHEAFIDWACRQALDRLGFGSPADIARFFDLVTIDEAKQWLDRQDGQSVRAVIVAGADRSEKALFARPDIEDVRDGLPALPDKARFLSPFDPVIRDRKRLLWLWGFDYKIEIYVPEKKRRFGYYIFPILDGTKLVGRIDMRADRKADALVVRRIWLEKGVKLSAGRRQRFETELARLTRFCGLSETVWDGSVEAGRSEIQGG